jgi:hypothetical protein
MDCANACAGVAKICAAELGAQKYTLLALSPPLTTVRAV